MRTGAAHTQISTDRFDPARAAALHATLGLSGPPPESGAPLPPFWHHIFFWDVRPVAELGQDGHPKKGGLIPDLGLPIRMWAGGRLTYHGPLLCGTRTERITALRTVTRKSGRTGDMAFLTLRHDYRQRGALVLTEEQDLVYRPGGAPPSAPPDCPGGGTLMATRQFDTTTLFRYSALTMNGHRIHYDADYARGGEGYPGLVVHGPLLAQHLIGFAEANLGAVTRFEFRATAPVFAGDDVRFFRRGPEFWAEGPGRRLAMTARAAAD